jgi:hypothetical protein
MEEPMSETTTEAIDPKAEQSETADKPLGENGEKALKAERDGRKSAERERDDLRKQLETINQANESAVEKAQREAKEAREAADKATTEALRFRVAAKHGISDEDADLFLHGTDAETLERQAAALVARTPTGPRPDPSQGAKGSSGARTPADSFADFFRNNI